jgi:AcrR family transcriptional regulator
MGRAVEQPGDERAPAGAGSQRVRHLLDVARDQFVARGFEAVSIDAIARTAGVSKETIYRHFADKEALFRAALEAAGEAFTARAVAVHDRAPTAGVELAGLARAILDSALDQGMFSALWVAVGVLHRMPDLAAVLREGQGLRLEPVREALEHYAREQGCAGAVDLELALDFGSLAVEGPALLMGFAGPGGDGRDRIAQRVAALFAQGLRGVGADAGDAPIQQPPPADQPADLAPHLRTLLSVAARHFLAHGYEAANLDAIGAEARVGRGTLYRHFGSKAGLFAAAMRASAHDCVAVGGPLPALSPGRADPAALARFLESALDCLASMPSIRLHHLVISQSRRDPALARDVYTILRAPWVRPLSHWLAGIGVRDDPGWYARQWLVLALRGNRLLAAGQPAPPADRRRYAARAVTIFFEGYIALVRQAPLGGAQERAKA